MEHSLNLRRYQFLDITQKEKSQVLKQKSSLFVELDIKAYVSFLLYHSVNHFQKSNRIKLEC